MRFHLRCAYGFVFLIGLLPLSYCCEGQEVLNFSGIEFVRIEPGEFTMGTGEHPPRTRDEWLARDEDESPAHRVKITQPFYMGRYEITNAQFEQFDPTHRLWRGKAGTTKEDREPVTQVTWQQAQDYCTWLTKKEGKTFRLPTEAEWEYACRAGTTTPFSTGETLSPEQANLGFKTDGKTRIEARTVGSYPPNAWGLYDMHGNVAEWCLDWYGPYESATQSDPLGRIDGHARAVRGWSYLTAGYQTTSRFSRCSNRSGHLPEDANRYTGFRVVQGGLPATKLLPIAELPLHQQKVRQEKAAVANQDSLKPYFLDFATHDASPVIPKETWGPIFSAHNHFTSACICPNGDVLVTWYTCVGESDRQLAQAASRLRAGTNRWEPASLFFNVPDVNCHAPVLLRDGQRLYHFSTQSQHGWDYSSNVYRYSDDSGATWSKPRIMLSRNDPQRLSQPCSALVAKDGTLVVACDGDSHRDEKLLLSADRGETWKVAQQDMRKAASGRYVIHPAIFEHPDGSIFSYLRGPDPMPLLVSRDRGDTWEERVSPFPGISVGAKSAVLKLSSGAVLMLTADRHKWFGGGVFVALSLDNGETWPHARKVTAPVGGYMSLAQAENGIIYLVGSRMKIAACNEAWIKEGKPLPTAKAE